MVINPFINKANINTDKIEVDTIYLPRYNHGCKYCIVQSLYDTKYKGKTKDISYIKDLVTNKMLMHRAKEICLDCPKIEALLLTTNVGK